MEEDYNLMTNDELLAKGKELDEAFKTHQEALRIAYQGMVAAGEEYDKISKILEKRGL